MNILITIGILLLLIAVVGFEVFFICAIKVNQEVEEPTVEKPNKAELSEEQKEKQEKLRKNFENLMNYDYNEALKSSKGE